jgi:hypothetical protein
MAKQLAIETVELETETDARVLRNRASALRIQALNCVRRAAALEAKAQLLERSQRVQDSTN